jgi:uncharacterized protein YggT (Ycf19 family)
MNRLFRILFDALGKILILVESVLGVRFVLRFLNANPAAEIMKLFYAVTNFLIAPFEGIFHEITVFGGVVDTVILSAAIAYTLVFFILKAIFVRR